MAMLRQASPWRKLEMVGEMNAAVHLFALEGLRLRFPQAGERELRRRLADLLLGSTLAEQAYGPLHAAMNDDNPRAFDQAQLSHRVMQNIPTAPGRTMFVASPEDTILAKLEWYRLGGEVSERQWRDVIGIVSVQGEQLDWEYLRRTAIQLGVADLLESLAPK